MKHQVPAAQGRKYRLLVSCDGNTRTLYTTASSTAEAIGQIVDSLPVNERRLSIVARPHLTDEVAS